MKAESVFHIEKIYVDQDVAGDALAQKVIKSLHPISVEVVRNERLFLDHIRSFSVTVGKRNLWITRFKGPLVKPCPGTDPSYLCCRYGVINIQTNCPLDCSYCILQGYLNRPVLTLYVNVEDIFQEINQWIDREPGRLLRVGTGELSDSLVLDPWIDWNRQLIQYASTQKFILELKTKTNCVEHLPTVKKRNVVISWSLNPSEVVRHEEFKTASIDERLKAAQRVVLKGYRLGFHFDPILEIDHWEEKYHQLIQDLTESVPEKEVLWISLGSLRFPSGFKRIMETRFPQSAITSGELIRGVDGKYRYFRPVRIQMYGKIYRELRKRWNDVFIYFCMENQDVWKDVMGFAPQSNAHLDYLFHESLDRRFEDLGLGPPLRESYVDEALAR